MIGIVYKATNRFTGKIVKIGSTIRSLRYRTRDKFYKDCFLFPIRVDSYEDSSFGVLHLRVREAQEISRHKMWYDQGGRNIFSPPAVWIKGADEAGCRRCSGVIKGRILFSEKRGLFGMPESERKEARKAGGLIQGERNVQSGHWATLQTREIRIKAAKAAGAKARDTGQINAIRTFEGSLKGALNQKTEDKIRGGITQGKKNVESGHLARIRHIRLHVKRNNVCADCSFCSAESK